MSYLTMDAMVFLADQEVTLWDHFKKYLADNYEIIIAGLAMLSGNYHAYSVAMLNK